MRAAKTLGGIRLGGLLLAGAAVLGGCGQPTAAVAPAGLSQSATSTTTAPPTTTTTTSPEAPPPPQAQVRPAPAGPPCSREAVACVRLSTKEAWLLNDGQVSYGPVPIMYGQPGHETPVGTFKVEWKAAKYRSRTYDQPMPHSVFFAPGGIAFHEGSLTEFSHGCVHLSPEAAKAFFDALPRRAVVQVVD